MATEASKKEAFRQYLEQAGVLDTMTKSGCCLCSLSQVAIALTPVAAGAVLVNLYEEGEKPQNAIE